MSMNGPVIINSHIASLHAVCGDDHSLNSKIFFQHDGVDLELAANNSMLLFENNFKCSEISIEMEV